MRRRVVVILLAAVALAARADAHEGPPYPVLVDQHVGPYTLSVWTDPDVGTGTFFVVFDPDAYRSNTDPKVTLTVWPVAARLAPTSHAATRQRDKAYRALIPFDQEERWYVNLDVAGSRGTGSTKFAVMVTPPGYGRWDLLIYLTPFLMVAGLWVLVTVRRRKLAREVT